MLPFCHPVRWVRPPSLASESVPGGHCPKCARPPATSASSVFSLRHLNTRDFLLYVSKGPRPQLGVSGREGTVSADSANGPIGLSLCVVPLYSQKRDQKAGSLGLHKGGFLFPASLAFT